MTTKDYMSPTIMAQPAPLEHKRMPNTTHRMPQARPRLRWGVSQNGELIAAFPLKETAEQYAYGLRSQTISSDIDVVEVQPNLLRMPGVQDRIGKLSKAWVYAMMKIERFPKSIPIGSGTTVVWIEHEIDEWIRESIRVARGAHFDERDRLARGETITTAIEQADGLLSGRGAGEARNASASMPAVSEAPIEPIKTRSPRREHHLDRIRRENTRSPREHHLNELERIRRENEMAEAK
jgi:predicted DNA-binding transcriptional regulator AlpA